MDAKPPRTARQDAPQATEGSGRYHEAAEREGGSGALEMAATASRYRLALSRGVSFGN